MALRSRHVGLNAYLHRIGAVDSPNCAHCGERETVEHYLLTCARFRKQRTDVRQALGRKPLDLINLLGHRNTGVLMRYVRDTNRFPQYNHPGDE